MPQFAIHINWSASGDVRRYVAKTMGSLQGDIENAGPRIGLRLAKANVEADAVGPTISCLVDTAAAETAIKASALTTATIPAIPGTEKQIKTPAGPIASQAYDISIWTADPNDPVCLIPSLRVNSVPAQKCTALLGQDFLCHCVLIHDGPKQSFHLQFS